MVKLPWLWMALALLLAAIVAAYSPGMSGGFLFDDFVNLDALGKTGPVHDWPAFWRFISSGEADPIGRPLSLLSFLLDARDWPADPAPFLRTNLCIHLVNTLLLFGLLRELGRAMGTEPSRNGWIALTGAGLWALHPLLVSTTLYVVQREAMLPATFALAGLLAYAVGRRRFLETQGAQGTAWMVGGIVGGTVLAVLCKANGILLPLLCLALETTVWREVGAADRSRAATSQFRRLKFVLLVLPSALLAAYLISFLPLLASPLANRPWTIGQRLLTEPRVLLEYLHLLLVPRSVSSGVYNDAYAVSTDWLHPAGTLPSALIIATAIGGAFALRKRMPRLSAAVLFFFAAHVLESTVIALELYFEHRNYLPSVLLFWPVAQLVISARFSALPKALAACLLLILMALTTFERAKLWGHPDQLIALWAMANPDSSRTQSMAGVALADAGDFPEAIRLLGSRWARYPDDLQVGFNFVDVLCRSRGLGTTERDSIASALARSSMSQELAYRWLEKGIGVASEGSCRGLDLDVIAAWVSAMARNPIGGSPNERRRTLEPLLARLALARHEPALALVHFNAALRVAPSPDLAARNVSALASAGYYREALAHLDVFESMPANLANTGRGMGWIHARILQKQGYWQHEFSELRRKLLDEIAREGRRPK